MLEVERVRAGYGAIEVLKEVSLTVSEGEIVTLLGANGAGKTTTLLTISGLLKARGGRVRFAGKDITGMAAHDVVRLGVVQSPEGRKIFSRLTVLENLEMGAFARTDAAAIQRDLEKSFGFFPVLAERKAQVAGTLSGGEQQMLAIARALMAAPRLLLLDEPSLGLAPLVVAKIFEVLTELNQQGATILLVEQNALMALRLAHRGYVMETGAITLSDKAAALLADQRVRSAYLGEA
jgi:branched-chain amino acid transport system ATP-binding protein